MLFYEDFLKKIDEGKFEIGDVEKFSPDTKRVIISLGIGIPMFIIALAQLYMAKIDGNLIRVAFAIGFIYMGIRQLRTTFSYKIQVDVKNKKMRFMKVDIDLEGVESCTLKEGKVGKKLEVMLDIITSGNQQYIIPLYMNKKIKFVWMMREIMGKKFIIKK